MRLIPAKSSKIHPFECSGIEPLCIRIPSLSGTFSIKGRNFLNLGDHVRSTGYVPAGMMKSAFSRVGNLYSCLSPNLSINRKAIVPVTALPFGRLRWRVIVSIVSNAGYDPAIMDGDLLFFLLNPHKIAGKGRRFIILSYCDSDNRCPSRSRRR